MKRGSVACSSSSSSCELFGLQLQFSIFSSFSLFVDTNYIHIKLAIDILR